MFKSEASLFLSANNNVNSAKTLINECKRLVTEFSLDGNTDFSNFKGNIVSCYIDGLVNKIEETKESLMKLDQEFASQYMTLLQEYLQNQTIDTSKMTEEEQMQYNIQMNAYARDYNQNLLYMLEKYEESGMLTEEMQQQLAYQRELVAQYDVQDKMAVLSYDTDEYIKLFKQNAEMDRNLIKLNPSFTEEQKESYLKEYEIQYEQNLTALSEARDARVKREADEKELEELYKAKEDNNGFWHPFVEGEIDEAILDKKIEMGIATEDEIAYKNMNGWDRFWTDTGTFAASTFTGLFNITEGIGDGFVMLGGKVGICDQDWAAEYISRDLSGELYDGIVLSTDMNTSSAYGTWHTAGESFGGFVGKVGMSFAAPWANALLSGFEAMGQSAETSLNSGADYSTAFAKSLVSGIGGAAEGYAMSKLNLGFRKFASSGALKTLGKSAVTNIKNLPSTLSSTPVKTLVWNGTKKTVKTIGTSFVSTLVEPDALIETGCVVLDGVIDGDDWTSIAAEAGGVFAVNWGMNFASDLAFGGGTKKPKVDDNSISKTEDFGKIKNLDTTTVDNSDLYMRSINSDTSYKVNMTNEYRIATDLRKSGLTDEQIANVYAAKATKCADINTKNKLYDFSYSYLARSTSPANAERLVREAFENQIKNRGMTTVFTDSSGIKYNVINGFNPSNQAYDLNYIRQQIDNLPPNVRNSVKEINIYDTRCPSDKYWSVEYNDPNFFSAATAGGGTINLWANPYKSDYVLSHESAHCFDSAFLENGNYYIGKYSHGSEYYDAVFADFNLSGSKSVTAYGGNNLGEDFAEAFAMYQGAIIDGHSINDFPNRKAFFDKMLSEGGFDVKNIGIDTNTTLAPSPAIHGKNNTSMFDHLELGERLPNWSTDASIARGKQAISSYELTSVGVSSGETKKLWADVLENEYRYDFSTPDGVKSIESLQKYYDNRLCQQVDNNIYDSIKQSIPHDSKLNVNSYKMNPDGTMIVDYTIDGVSTNKTLSKFEVDEIFSKGYETAGIDTMNIILHFEENIPNVGTSRAYKYESLVKYNSGQDVVNHMTANDIAEYEAVWKEKMSIDTSGNEYNFGFFTTEYNVKSYAGDGHVIGWPNTDGTRTQWAMSLSSLKENLCNMKYNGSKLTIDSIKNMSDIEIQYLAEDLIAVPRGSYTGQELIFIAGDKNINITNMTSNSLKGANDYYTAYGRTAGNLFEADVGSVDVYDSTVTKKSINGIREMFISLLS